MLIDRDQVKYGLKCIAIICLSIGTIITLLSLFFGLSFWWLLVLIPISIPLIVHTIWDAKKICDPALLPEIKDLLNLGYVNKEICGTFEKIESEITTPSVKNNKESLLNIYDRYRHIVTTWTGYTKKEKEDEPAPIVVNPGRNDPCPCGSGKKYKKCCLLNT